MAKKQVKAERPDPLEWDGIIELHGYRVQCLGALHLLMAGSTLDLPAPPTYTFTDAAGVEVTRAYDERSIEDPKATDADRAAWARYQQELRAIKLEREDQMMRRLILKCVEILDMPPEDEWVAEHRDVFGYDVPDGRLERVLHFARTEVIITPSDYVKVMTGVVRASGADEEVLDLLEAQFRDSVAERAHELWGPVAAAMQAVAEGAGEAGDGEGGEAG